MLISEIFLRCGTDIPWKFFPLSKENIKLLTYFGKSQVGFVFLSVQQEQLAK